MCLQRPSSVEESWIFQKKWRLIFAVETRRVSSRALSLVSALGLLVLVISPNLRAESFRCSRLCFGGFLFTILGRRGGFQRAEQPVRNGGDVINRSQEGLFIRF